MQDKILSVESKIVRQGNGNINQVFFLPLSKPMKTREPIYVQYKHCHIYFYDCVDLQSVISPIRTT